MTSLTPYLYFQYTVYVLIEAQSVIETEALPATNILHQIHTKSLISDKKSKDHEEH